MWLVELMALVLVVGTVSGLVWRYGEEWLERRNARLANEALMEGEEEEPAQTELNSVSSTVSKAN